MSDYIGRSFISKDGYRCKIVRDLEENTNIRPSKRNYEIQYDDGTLTTYNYQTLKLGSFRKELITYKDREFISSDGYKCKIIKDLNENIDIAPSLRNYEVQFEDGTLATYNYDTLNRGIFKKSNIINIICKEFTSSDGYKCKIVRDLDENTDITPSHRRYEVQFEDGTLATYSYRTLKRGSFRKEPITYKGREFISEDGYKCKIIRDLDENTDIMLSQRSYEVEFKDGTLATYSYRVLKRGIFKKSKFINYIGKEFISRNGYKCKIVRDLEENSDIIPSKRRYEVQFEDGTLATYNYPTLRQGEFNRNALNSFIGKEFVSKDGYKCKIIKDLEKGTNIMPSKRHYEVQFEDNTIKVYHYNTLQGGYFKKETVKQESYIGREFISKDGYKCKIIRDMDKDTNKRPSNRNYEVQFEDGILAIYHYTTLKKGEFIRPKYFKQAKHTYDYYRLCKCKICELELLMDNIMMCQHLRIHHQIDIQENYDLL